MEIFRKLEMLIRRNKVQDELAEEMAFHREQAQRELEEDGVPSAEARSAAARQFGNTALLKEQALDPARFRFETVFQDARYALRQLRHNPGFALTAIVVLALGIGAASAIFSAVNPILLEPLPYPDARKLTMLWEHDTSGRPSMINFADYHGLSERSRSFDAIAAFKAWQPTVTGEDQPERLEGQRVSEAFFRVLGIPPQMGRAFQATDDAWRGPKVVILSNKLWQRRFAGDREIVGTQIKLDDDNYTVIGVMPPDFENVTAPDAELWAPLQYNPTLPPQSREWGHHLRMIGRLHAGTSPQQATSELAILARQLGQLYAAGYNEAGGPPAGYLVDSLQKDATSDVRPALLAVFGAVLILLVIACVNVANLLLARAAQRRGEFAMRAALGAGSMRIGRQLLTESLLLAIAGGALGLLVARVGIRALLALSPAGVPRLNDVRLNGAVFVFALLVSSLIGIAVGLVPAMRLARSDPQSALQQSSQRAAGGHQWTRRVLVVAEVAMALVLLVSAGLLLHSLRKLLSTDPGFDSANVLTMRVQESGHRYDDDAARNRFFEHALERVRQVPGVLEAGFTSQLPLSGDQEGYGATFEKDVRQGGDMRAAEVPAFRYAVTPGYLETMHIPLVHGRLFNDRDTTDAQHYCRNTDGPRPANADNGAACGAAPTSILISEWLAKSKFGAADPLGQRLKIVGPGGPNSPWAIIVGVVGNVRQESLGVAPENAFYVPMEQWYWGDQEMSLVVRTRGDATALIPALRQAIWSVDKDQPIVHVATMQRLVEDSEAQRRFAMIIFEAFALAALMLAATGVFGVLSGSVTERTREIGVRAALGASRGKILTLVIRQGMLMTFAGIVIGLAAAVLATRVLVTLLFGISPLDPLTYFSVMALLAGVSAISCAVPAWRAASVDPAITLRAE